MLKLINEMTNDRSIRIRSINLRKTELKKYIYILLVLSLEMKYTTTLPVYSTM